MLTSLGSGSLGCTRLDSAPRNEHTRKTVSAAGAADDGGSSNDRLAPLASSNCGVSVSWCLRSAGHLAASRGLDVDVAVEGGRRRLCAR